MSDAVRIVLILSESWTLVEPRDLRQTLRMAKEAEDAGIDAVMVSEHVVLGPGCDTAGLPQNPRDYVVPFNHHPATPVPNPMVHLAAIAGATSGLRLIVGAVIAPLYHPLILAKQLATLDLVSEGRAVVLPTVSWFPGEYEALGVPFNERGARLDEHLDVWRAVWEKSPASHSGPAYPFEEVYLEPKPHRQGGPPIWFGGSSLHKRLIPRIVRHGSGFLPLWFVTGDEIAEVAMGMKEGGRDISELEIVGGIVPELPVEGTVALEPSLATLPAIVEAGMRTVCMKPSQFIDDPAEFGDFCRRVVKATEGL